MGCIPMRWVISLMGTYSCALMFMQRCGMSVAIVKMTRFVSNVSIENGSDWSSTQLNKPEFDWDETQQGIILGASFYLYWCTPAVVGSYTDKLGGKWFALIGVLGPCILTAITPVVARELNLGPLVALQTLMGFFHGFTYPTFFSLYVQWFPSEERPKANSGIQVGVAVGSCFMYILAGYLCETSIGWPLVFYVMSIFHVPWIVLWLYFGANRPEESKRITDSELKYIIQHNQSKAKTGKRVSTPWLAIFTSGAVWGSIVSKMSTAYGYFMFLSKLPTYLSLVFNMSIVNNGMNNSATMLAYGISAFIAPYLANYLIHHTTIRPIIIRKCFQSFSVLGPAVCLILISQAHESQSGAVALLVLSLFLYGFFTGGEWTLISDYAPNFAGTVIGVAHMLAFAMGIVAPYIVGVILDSNIGDMHTKWNIVFFHTAAFYLFGNIFFLLTGTNKQQSWDKFAELSVSSKV